ncbi:transglutaminase domain-containing protein [Frankia sp. CNm7]|uniref:Transglutaminase domain-containing protein n=1 Tax=Frankia nepalensis TaxID=1836974 RepID=A0A937UU61_9ACTN|nr:transglutaminase domain-containing protein [Frankia nepalensis]MBL7497260.1 transglutaminase domain-containing protein [Frankia nepalensis]MBL7512165.1 transglutaminase domain-containing protein [Frankia nepalensis]MBL7520390.1 transglutaminase domain-containing protein [Frankia nepalensis]MBL7631935.1 transglutaminase domain-containing protein [Frankia nepalensis]
MTRPPTPTGATARPSSSAVPPPGSAYAPTAPVAPTPVLIVAIAHLPAAFMLGALFDGAGYLVPVAGAVAAAALTAWFAARRLASLELVAFVGVVSGLAYGTMTKAGRVSLVARGLRDGWGALLSAPVPAQPEAALLIAPAAALWAAAFAAVVLALRARAVLAPAVPPLLALVAVLVLVGDAGAGDARTRVLATGGFVALVLAMAVARTALPAPASGRGLTRRGRPTHAATGPVAPVAPTAAAGGGSAPPRGSGALMFGLPVVVVIAALGTLAGTVLPVGDHRRFDPRDHYHPPVGDVAVLNPLARVRSQLETSPPATLFTIRLASGTGSLPVDRVRLAALGEFDGASWRDDGHFLRVERTLPEADEPLPTLVARVDVRAEVTVGGLEGVLLPSLGRPSYFDYAGDGRGGAFSPASGALAALTTPRQGDRYELATRVPAPSREQLAAARPASGPAAAPYLGLPPGLPPALVDIAAQVTASAERPYDKLVALERFLRDDTRFPYDLSAAPGHSYGVLSRMMTGTGPADSRAYAEQRATAFAVLARTSGFATRMSVGYLLDQGREDDGTFTVTTQQAHAWPEVLLDGIGWVAFEPTDVTQLTRTLPPPSVPTAPTGDAGAGRTVTPEPVSPIIVPTLDDSGAPDRRGATGGGLAWPWTVLMVVGGALLLLPSLVVAEKARRRRGRRGGAVPARVVGAWLEARDRLAERGVARSDALTQREVVGLVVETPLIAPAAGPLRQLAALADRAMFAPAGPGASAGVDPAEAWRLLDEIRRELRANAGLGTRLRAAVDPRPLLPRPRPGRPPAAARLPRGPAPAPLGLPPPVMVAVGGQPAGQLYTATITMRVSE